MALIEEAVVALLTGDAAVNALIDGRMEPQPLSQKSVFPAISYLIVSQPHVHSHQNDLGTSGRTGLSNPLFQIDLWDEVYDDVKNLAEKVRLAMDGFRGTVSGVVINAILLENQRDIYEERISSDEQRVHRVMTEYRVWFNEPQS